MAPSDLALLDLEVDHARFVTVSSSPALQRSFVDGVGPAVEQLLTPVAQTGAELRSAIENRSWTGRA